MKNKNKFILILIILTLFCSLSSTLAYFSSTTELVSIFNTKNYVFKLNAKGGKFSSESIVIEKGKTTLPTPTKTGYNFLGYSISSNGNTNYSTNINNINEIENKEIYATWQVINYSISYNLNGGTLTGQKTTYNVEETFTLPTPTKAGYSFTGWTGSNGTTKQINVVVPKGTINNLSYTANWNTNSYQVDVNPIIDGTTYNSGLDGYTFNVWVNGNLVAQNVKDWCQNVSYGSTVRVKANSIIGRSTSYDKTITVGSSNTTLSPTWTTNTYEAHFYLNGSHRLTTYNKYGAYIQTPNTNAGALGYDSNFYYLSGFTPWETWYQPDKAVGFTINISEYNCASSFGSAGSSNASYQLTKLRNAGYNFCETTDWGSLWCVSNYSNVINLYNNAWNILPRSGNGYSIYKQMSCDSGWSNVQRR